MQDNITLSDITITGLSDEARMALEAILAASNVAQPPQGATTTDNSGLLEPELLRSYGFEAAVAATPIVLEPVPVKKVRKAKVQEEIKPIEVKVEVAKPEFFDNPDSKFFNQFLVDNLKSMSINDSNDFAETAPLRLNNYSTYQDINIIIVGCGGTGARLLNLIAQFAAFSSSHLVRITLIDPDVVEIKNLSRQQFYEFEIGEAKSEALAERYSLLYNINIDAHACLVKDWSYIDLKVCSTFIFDCTDNLKARQDIDDLKSILLGRFREVPVVTISCGNQKDFGQVVFGGTFSNYSKRLIRANLPPILDSDKPMRNAYENIRNILASLAFHDTQKVGYLPSMLDVYPELKDTESASCADMAIAEEQSMAINSTIAQTAFNMFFSLINRNGKLKSSIVWANLDNDYSAQRITTKGSLLEYYAKSIYGRNLYGERLDLAKSFINNIVNIIRQSPSLLRSELLCPMDKYTRMYAFYIDSNHTPPIMKCLDTFIDSLFKEKDSWLYLPLMVYFIDYFVNECFASVHIPDTHKNGAIRYFVDKIYSYYSELQKDSNFVFFRG